MYPVAVVGDPSREDLQPCWELGSGRLRLTLLTG
jgi:hypothetical protein